MTTINLGKIQKTKGMEIELIQKKPKRNSEWKEISEEEYYGHKVFSKWYGREKLEKLASFSSRKKRKKQEKEDKLVVTNYDNFKNAAFFISQYYKAKDMLEEVDMFFKSFIMSKLIRIEDIDKVKVNSVDFGEWMLNFFSSPYEAESKAFEYDYVRGDEYGKSKDYYYYNETKHKDIVSTIVKKVQTSKKMNDKKFKPLFVLDENGILHDFVPECLSGEISIDFNEKAIVISGKYYHYHEWGARWGQSESAMDEITVKAVINPSNNNVLGVFREEKTIQPGNANGKSYWDHHDNYCLPRISGDLSYSTPQHSERVDLI